MKKVLTADRATQQKAAGNSLTDCRPQA